MKVKVLRKFHDRKENVIRETGEVFEATDKRFAEIQKGLSKYGNYNWVEEVAEKPIKKG